MFYIFFLLSCVLGDAEARTLPIVDEGLYILQGVDTCGNGSGYCILGSKCTLDVEFIEADPGQHCQGLTHGFTPPVNFTCCRYNEYGKESSVPPTTTHPSFTLTDVDKFIQEEAIILEHEENNEVPEGVDVSSIIKIVGVITDTTGVLGLITEPYSATVPVQSSATTPPGTTAGASTSPLTSAATTTLPSVTTVSTPPTTVDGVSTPPTVVEVATSTFPVTDTTGVAMTESARRGFL